MRNQPGFKSGQERLIKEEPRSHCNIPINQSGKPSVAQLQQKHLGNFWLQVKSGECCDNLFSHTCFLLRWVACVLEARCRLDKQSTVNGRSRAVKGTSPSSSNRVCACRRHDLPWRCCLYVFGSSCPRRHPPVTWCTTSAPSLICNRTQHVHMYIHVCLWTRTHNSGWRGNHHKCVFMRLA